MEDLKFVVRNSNILNSKRKRKDFFKKIIILFSVIFIVIASLYVYDFYKNKFHLPFDIENIKVLNVKNANISKINEILQQYKHQSLKNFPIKKVYNQLKNLQWVDDVIIHKNYPSTLIVEIKETSPLSIVSIKNQFYLFGKNGKLIKDFKSSYFNRGYYIVSFNNIKDFMKNREKILTIIPQLENSNIKNISEITINENLNIYTFKPHRIYILDINNLEKNLVKIKLLERMKKLLMLNDKNFQVINLKYKNKIFIKL